MRTVKKIFFVIPVVLCFMNMTCDADDDVDLSSDICDQITVVSNAQFDNLVSDNFTFGNVEITKDCLTIEISSSGCSGDSWEFNLIDSGVVAESSPEQRYLKLKLINNEACLAVFERTISFDLTPLQVNDSNLIILHVDGVEISLEYSY